MRSLSDYLDLTEAEAADQWRRILLRSKQPRQEPFLAVEVILAFGLFLRVDPHRYGGKTVHLAPVEVHRLAELFVRPPSSITSKMLNLDGSRKNGGRLEPEVYFRLVDEPDRFFLLYSRILSAARNLGISEERLPGFLDAFEGRFDLLGQGELGEREIGTLLREQDAELEELKSVFGFTERETTKIVEQRARIGQHRFAREVLANYGHRCAFCGFAPHSLRGTGLLRASHIKPWRDSTNRERLDPANGLSACPVHDSVSSHRRRRPAADRRVMLGVEELHAHTCRTSLGTHRPPRPLLWRLDPRLRPSARHQREHARVVELAAR